MPLAKFETMLKRTMGLDIQSIGRPMLERALHERRGKSGSDDLDAYWLLLQMSEQEQLHLIESVIVPETWFFRNREAFNAMAQLALQRPANASQPMRVLSLPCSTGEEPYSIAMALLDIGLAPQQFHVDAIDISPQSLDIARQAVYGKNSFRGNDLAFRDHYFAFHEHGYALSETVRQQVRFIQGNLFAADLLLGEAPYDIIFCRNLLIYFDRPTQHQAITILSQHLASEGLLFVGPAESPLIMQHPFTSLNAPMAFAFRQGAPKAQDIAKPSAPPLFAQPPRSAQSRPSTRVLKHAPIAVNIPAAATIGHESLDTVQNLADQGKLAEAASLCEQLINRNGGTAAAYYLMGVIHDAADRKQEAAECYRKAIYLEPTHAGALTHLAALLQIQGDEAAAKLLLQRARRAADNT
ncbi:cheR methyltransferase, SAM binding domain protein [Collimonas arenae]|uniref:CheR methyltransferase, SAM binding domain protein n=1 Tax=Collimonas arenae TaxID=279058 RepID=A0A127PQ06_9BURK|nr:CheR family methyltransferase [Collimonas arenae]AMO99890.1 cheR methyltransferase, SAM binding domain protein [Collimonas arenae]AMP09787.1 cheR methyltransferase, SAM binding domain protein [Collimonas arenae]